MKSKTTTRRAFIKTATSAAVGSSLLRPARNYGADSPNNKVVLGIIGPGGMGTNLLRSFVTFKDVEIAYVCDADKDRMAKAASAVAANSGKTPKTIEDMRRIFEDKDVDGVIIATPDHWHAPATILACDAGKHVYVEKPCSHNIREGRLMIDAARRNKRVVQVGTQTRSTGHVIRAMQLLRDGAIGEVLVAKAWNSQLRGTIGRAKPAEPPANLNFDLWVGPAPMVSYQSNLLHGIWRWWFAFGTGDMGNDGVHDIDVARWGLGVDTHPTKVAALGGKYFFEDDQQFPDTQYVVFEYEPSEKSRRKKQFIFEQRIWSPYFQEGFENGNAFYGTKGMMILGKGGGWQLFGPRNEPRDKMTGKPDGPAHHRNFLECVKSGARPNADIEINHHSTTLCHLGNIATRLGRTLQFDPKNEQIVGDEEANRLIRRDYRKDHWAVPAGV